MNKWITIYFLPKYLSLCVSLNYFPDLFTTKLVFDSGENIFRTKAKNNESFPVRETKTKLNIDRQSR